MIAWYAYREWKGVAEDCAGGSVTMTTTGNVLNYAIIDKREDDAIAEKEAKRKRLEELRRQADQNEGGDEEETPLNQ